MVAEPAVYEATRQQDELWRVIEEAPPGSLSIVGYGGAAGGGKTRALVELAIDFALSYPGTRLLLARKDFADLRTTTMEEFYRALHPSLRRRVHGSEHWCDVGLPNTEPSRVYFGELKDYLSLGSEQYGFVGIDEAGEVPEASMHMLLTRMREPHAAKYAIVCASNPWPGWFKRWFIDRDLDEVMLNRVGGAVHFIPARISDNPHLPENYEDLLRAALPPDWVQRFVEGRWDAFAGQVYPEFHAVMHRWDKPLPVFTRVVGGLDFGGQNPWAHKTAGIVSGLSEGKLIRFSEFEEAGSDVYERQIAWMSGVEKRIGRRVNWVADRSQMLGIQLLKDKGFLVEQSHGGSDSVSAGIGLVRRRLLAVTQGLTWGSYYTPECVLFPRRVESYRWAEPRGDDATVKPKPVERDDDLMDADRYMHEEADGFPSIQGPAILQSRNRQGVVRRAPLKAV